MVIGVAGPASHAGIFLQLVSVQRGWILKLGGDVRMALHTAVCHHRFLPEKGMAGPTPAAELSVGGDAAQ